ncbi:MAG: glycosyltransferase family 4 protein [Fibrobacteria bacterium]|nr:glycosyltransferase family 4 protein [Fibrobacteria bacterium]
MRIAYLVCSLNPGGVATLLKHVIPVLREKGNEIDIIVTTEKGIMAAPLEASGVTVHECLSHWHYDFKASYTLGKWFRKSAIISFIPRLALLLKSLKVDLVHSHIHGLYCTSQLLAARLSGIPYILTMHSISSNYQKKLINKMVFCNLLRDGDSVCMVSKSVHEAYPYFTKKISKNLVFPPYGVPNGVIDSGPIDPNISLKVRKELGVSHECGVIGSIGRVVHSKHYDQILTVLARLIKAGKPTHFILVGDGPELENLKTLAQQLGVSEYCSFTGHMTNPEYWINAFDIYLFPTAFEGFPIAILEAMMKGIPLVCSNVSGNKDIIINRKNGLLFEFGDVDAMYNHTLTLMDDKVLAETLSRNSRNDFLDKYHINKFADTCVEIYKQRVRRKSQV